MLDTIDLNCDVGEVNCALDHSLLPWVSSCNVSCGEHAGDPVLMASTVREALRLGVSIGAHPSYPDRDHFGRRSMELPLEELTDHLRHQIAALQGTVVSLGGQLQHIKPHGALYNDVVQDVRLAEAVVDVVRQVAPDVALFGQADSHLAGICEHRQVRFVHEVFGDRRYEGRTTLRSRTHGDAVLNDEDDFLRQLLALLEGHVVDVHQQRHALTVQTLCLHSDTPHALEFARLANRNLKENHVRMAAP